MEELGGKQRREGEQKEGKKEEGITESEIFSTGGLFTPEDVLTAMASPEPWHP